MKKLSILHITPHLGGGVGRVLLNYLSKVQDAPCYTHQVACLDYANAIALEKAKLISLILCDRMYGHINGLLDLIAKADIVFIHWWNHPLLYDFLVRTPLSSARIIFWSHISGFHPPYIFTDKVLRYPDLFVFTTPVSYETKEVQNLPDECKQKLRVVWSTAGLEHVRGIKPQEHNGFNIGYIGTVDYCKMHPDFLHMCSSMNIPNAHFIVCGGPQEEELRQQAEQLGLSSKISFTGLVNDITPYLSEFDVFGYPLAPYHYGTCDQVLAESMAAGVVPVVLANKMERLMVEDGVTGIVAKDKTGYIQAIEKLYHNPELRHSLSQNAKKAAFERFTLDSIQSDWDKIFEEVLVIPKTTRKWNINKNSLDISAKDVFLESLGDYGRVFSAYCSSVTAKEKEYSVAKIKELGNSAIWQAKTRGTIHHYTEFFKDEPELSFWKSLMEGNNNSFEKPNLTR